MAIGTETIILPEAVVAHEKRSAMLIDEALKSAYHADDMETAVLEDRFLRWASNQRTYGLLKFIVPEGWNNGKMIASKMQMLCEKYPDLGYAVWVGQDWEKKGIAVKHCYLVKQNPDRKQRSQHCSAAHHGDCTFNVCSCYCHEVIKLRERKEQLIAEAKAGVTLTPEGEAMVELHRRMYTNWKEAANRRDKRIPSSLTPNNTFVPSTKREWMKFIKDVFEFIEPPQPKMWTMDNSIMIGPLSNIKMQIAPAVKTAVSELNDVAKDKNYPYGYGIDSRFYVGAERYIVIFKAAGTWRKEE